MEEYKHLFLIKKLTEELNLNGNIKDARNKRRKKIHEVIITKDEWRNIYEYEYCYMIYKK